MTPASIAYIHTPWGRLVAQAGKAAPSELLNPNAYAQADMVEALVSLDFCACSHSSQSQHLVHTHRSIDGYDVRLETLHGHKDTQDGDDSSSFSRLSCPPVDLPPVDLPPVDLPPVNPLAVQPQSAEGSPAILAPTPLSGSQDTVPLIHRLVRELDEYVHGERMNFSIPLAPAGTAFMRSVWHATCRISYGSTATYTQIADEIAAPRAVRAVGTALRRNPLLIVVPCHRVLPRRGGLGQYRGGIERKQALLEHEQSYVKAQSS